MQTQEQSGVSCRFEIARRAPGPGERAPTASNKSLIGKIFDDNLRLCTWMLFPTDARGPKRRPKSPFPAKRRAVGQGAQKRP